MRNSITDKLSRFARTLTVLAFWVIVWYFIAKKVDMPVLVASPTVVFKRLLTFAKTKEFYISVLYSVFRILSGFFTAVAAGTILGILTAKIKLVNELISPLLTIIKATPVASFIVLALVWIDKQTIPSFIAFLMVLPIIHGNVSMGLKNTPKELIEMTTMYNISPLHKLTKLYIPSITPYFAAGFKTSLGLAWKAGVAAEVLSFPKNSIGKELYEAKTYLETVDVFVWTLTIIIISMVIEKALMLTVKKLTEKTKEEQL